MNIKTVTTVDGVNVVDFGSAASRFYWIENLGSTTVYVSGNENIVPDGDNVKVLSAGCGTMVENLGGKVYILGAGKFQITNQGDKFPPFRNAPVADGGVMASGNPVQIDGLQEGVPFSEMAVSGKNLMPFPYYDGNSKTHNGITFTVNADGTITANGTATASAIFYISTNYTIKKGIYTLSGCPKSDSNTNYILQFATGDWSFKVSDFGNGATTQIDNDINLQIFRIAISNGVVCDNLVFRPQLELGSTPTEYEPPITGRELQVNVCGKNLFGDVMNYYLSGTQTNGFNFKPSSANSFCFLGTIINNTNYTIKNYSNGNRFKIVLFKNYPNQAAPDECMEILPTDSNTVTFNSGEYNYCVLSVAYNDENITIKKAQLEIGITPTDYEQYHGSTTTITPDSNPYVIPNDIRQQEGLNVVSVSEGELSVTGVRKNAAVKKIWDKIDELTTAIIVSNGETIE